MIRAAVRYIVENISSGYKQQLRPGKGYIGKHRECDVQHAHWFN